MKNKTIKIEGNEVRIIQLLYEMLYDSGWDFDEIEEYLKARIEE